MEIKVDPGDSGKDDRGVTAPQTGDASEPVFWITLFMVSMAGLVGMLVKGKREDRKM